MADENADSTETRDYLYCLEIDFDIDAQLAAIRELLRRNLKAKEVLSEEIDRFEERARRLAGTQSDFATDEWVDRLHHSVYQDAAHSMATVGMLAPFVETIFHQCFLAIGKRFFPIASPVGEHVRWDAASSIQWDCHYVLSGRQMRKDLTRGILQLADAVNLTRRLPADLEQVLSLLLAYRNKMFHLGFEWPVDERERFEQRIAQNGWPINWILKATTAEKPWIFYLSEDFINHCLSTIDKVLDGISAFIRDELLPRQGGDMPSRECND